MTLTRPMLCAAWAVACVVCFLIGEHYGRAGIAPVAFIVAAPIFLIYGDEVVD